MDNYEEKYKAALGWMQRLYGGLHGATKVDAEHYFPELKEDNNDEKIRKALIEMIHDTTGDECEDCYHVSKESVLAWLEKQQSFDKDKLAKGFLRSVATSIMNWLDANTSEGKMCLSNMECEDIENAVLNADWSKVYAYMRKKLEKQGEQKPNPYSGTSFEYNGHIWGMCARDNGVDILLDKQLFKHLEKQGNKIVDCQQNHQDVKYPNGGIVMEDFNGGEGFYKLQLDYLNKKQVEEVEEMVRTWNKESKTLNADDVIEWLKTKVYDDSTYGMAMIDKFKKDFEL